MPPYLQRLRQRKIVQWAIAYAAVAWLSLEVFDLVAEQFFWPVWIRQGATVLLLFGLFITIVLAWYHGEHGRQKPGWVELVLLTALIALAGQSVWSLRDQYQSIDPETGLAVSSFRSEPLPENSVAVLPCLNLSADENQSYFADGLAAELITRLTAVSGLRISSHTSSFSFRGKDLSVREIAASLRVRHVLECDVSGDETRVRVATRLVDTDSGYTLWSESYNRTRDKLFDVQQDVAQAVVEKLKVSLGTRERQLVNRRWTDNTEAYDEFLRAVRYQAGYPTVETISATRVHLERAIELDPQFGRAYARLAVNWVYFGNYRLGSREKAYGNVRRYAAKAVELDGELWEAYWALGWAEMAGEFAWLEAEHNFRKVIELAPGEWGGYHSLGYVLGVLGRTEEGLLAARMAIDVDPLGFLPLHGLEVLLTRQRRYEASISVTLEQAEVVGWNPELRTSLAWLLASQGLEQEARMQLNEISASDLRDNPLELNVASVLAMLGDREQALEIVKNWDQERSRSVDQFYVGALAFTYAVLGDRESAIQKLLETWERREMFLLFLDYEAYDDLRDDPRFVKLIRELNLPEDIYLRSPARGEVLKNR
jgi:TolB-like protein/tetratricopeptide (TPR) repeat protein